ncbi:hypothetical protein [Spiroplasma endosymbiont of Danaus chrysippus]|uniref:hypothetical protein n=1 Tax=Spiroplasma endosymbiont of Danaus chrysippus TaxID=2691041 RepID=UPI00157AA738|nr:hypothetical protein [Spiroplasma endosymbiont of Danaus chrysippus]
MTNYLLSIDPSIKNTGFTLWEKKIYCDTYKYIWKPILISSCSFKKNGVDNFNRDMHYVVYGTLELKDELNNSKNNFDLIIERGTFHSKNGIGYETQEHLRGFIAGQFNKLITKDMLISPSEWKKWYVKNDKYCSAITFVNGINYKWDKNISLFMCENLIKKNNWNIKISNHDEADSLLIGWYYLNKENK